MKQLDEKLIRKIINLNIKHENEKTKLDIEYLMLKINKYKSLTKILTENKPCFFQRKKIIEYNNKIEKYNNKIYELYCDVSKELYLASEIKALSDD